MAVGQSWFLLMALQEKQPRTAQRLWSQKSQNLQHGKSSNQNHFDRLLNARTAKDMECFTPTLIFENLKPVLKNHLDII